MSLRNKIIVVFVGLPVVPLLTLATFAYWLARSLLADSVLLLMAQTATEAGRVMAREKTSTRWSTGSPELSSGAE